jgi:tight adherence protein B
MSLPILILVLGGGLALLMLIVGIAVSIRTDSALIEERMDQLAGQGQQEAVAEEGRQRSSPLTDWLNTRVEGTSFADRISRDLARADLKMKPAEYIGLLVIASGVVGFLAWFLGGRDTVGLLVGIIGAVVGFFLPGMYVKRQQGKRLQKVDLQLPDMLSLMVNGLRAGFSTMQAMESVSKEMPTPISDEFRRVVQEMQLGVPMPKALDNLLRRVPSDDMDFVVTAINVQREVGGNLAEIMDTISYTIRERVRIKGEIRVLTSQVRYSGRFLALMPVILMAMLYFMNRSYMMEFFNNPPCGYIALAVAALLIGIGFVVMNRLGDIEI